MDCHSRNALAARCEDYRRSIPGGGFPQFQVNHIVGTDLVEKLLLRWRDNVVGESPHQQAINFLGIIAQARNGAISTMSVHSPLNNRAVTVQSSENELSCSGQQKKPLITQALFYKSDKSSKVQHRELRAEAFPPVSSTISSRG